MNQVFLAIAVVTETGGFVLALLQGDFVLCRQAPPVNLMHKTHDPIDILNAMKRIELLNNRNFPIIQHVPH